MRDFLELPIDSTLMIAARKNSVRARLDVNGAHWNAEHAWGGVNEWYSCARHGCIDDISAGFRMLLNNAYAMQPYIKGILNLSNMLPDRWDSTLGLTVRRRDGRADVTVTTESFRAVTKVTWRTDDDSDYFSWKLSYRARDVQSLHIADADTQKYILGVVQRWLESCYISATVPAVVELDDVPF